MNSINIRLTDDLTDITLVLKNGTTQVVMKLHKIILYYACEYFEKLLTKFKEKNMDEITIEVPNPHVCQDIIMAFYGKKTNSGGLPEWQHRLEYIRCCDFLGITLNFSKYNDIIVPTEGIELLLKIADLTNYPNDVMIMVVKNIPEDYDLEKLDENLVMKIKKNKNNRLASCSSDGTIKIWYTETGDLINTLNNSGWVMSVAFSPDGETIASGSSDNTITIWDSITCQIITTLKGGIATQLTVLLFHLMVKQSLREVRMTVSSYGMLIPTTGGLSC